MFKPKVLVLSLLILTAAVPIYNVKADALVWWGDVSSNGTPITSITSVMLQKYRIVATEVFEYNDPYTLAADAMYYTTDYPDSWNWVSHYALPDSHSFLQINGGDVDWGPFSNGDTYHTYTKIYIGDGNPIIFKIEDWRDGDYGNNLCHLRVKIYEEETHWGFTPGFWKNHVNLWPEEYEPEERLQDVFGAGAPDVSLLEALQLQGGRGIDGAKETLARSATAALLNSLALDGWYKYTESYIISTATEKFSSGSRDSIINLANDFAYWNKMEPPGGLWP